MHLTIVALFPVKRVDEKAKKSTEQGGIRTVAVLLYDLKGLYMELPLIRSPLTGCLRARETNPRQKSRGLPW